MYWPTRPPTPTNPACMRRWVICAPTHRSRGSTKLGRDPNKHLAFGYGVHFCLGAALARMELNSFFTELLPRLKSIEVTAPPEPAATTLRRRAQAPTDPLRAVELSICILEG